MLHCVSLSHFLKFCLSKLFCFLAAGLSVILFLLAKIIHKMQVHSVTCTQCMFLVMYEFSR